ncbi:hypothetical protein ES703_121645 [subsurface metagenome]
MGGSEESPVSRALMCLVRSSKHSSKVSKPDLDPNTENHGVQTWAGIKKALSLASRVISSKSLESRPRMGLPSEVIFPIRSNCSFSLSTDAMSGIRIR